MNLGRVGRIVLIGLGLTVAGSVIANVYAPMSSEKSILETSPLGSVDGAHDDASKVRVYNLKDAGRLGAEAESIHHTRAALRIRKLVVAPDGEKKAQ